MTRRNDAYTKLADYLTKYSSLDDVIEDKDESILWELLKYDTDMNSTEFDEVYTLAVDSGLALPRCRHCGELTPRRHGTRGRIRKFCGTPHNAAFRRENRHLVPNKNKSLGDRRSAMSVLIFLINSFPDISSPRKQSKFPIFPKAQSAEFPK